MKALTLSEIWIYPVKSLGGIRLASAKVLEKGLAYDRRWMLLDEKGEFMTQRVHPQMALFKTSIHNEVLTICRQGTETSASVSFNIHEPPKDEALLTHIWNDPVRVIEVDPGISKWFSRYMGFSCKLVSFPEQNAREVDAAYNPGGIRVSLADAFPFMIIGQSSLDDLNRRLETPVPMNRFRPNFVFTGGEPYEEDHWQHLTIGENRFAGLKNCVRCILPTINQDTAERGSEPLLTLSTYRKHENKVLFGRNLIALDHGRVSVGDPIVLN